MVADSFNHHSCHAASKQIHCLNISVTNFSLNPDDSAKEKLTLFLLSQNSTSCWITLTILFIFISLNLILYHLEQLLHFHQREKKSIEMIDFTNEEEYRALQSEEFQVRYGSRALVHQVKPYDLYGHFHEQRKRPMPRIDLI